MVTALFCTISAEQLIRVNEAGYFPNGRKNLVIISDKDINGLTWNIVDKSGTLLQSGTIGTTEAGSGNYSPKEFNYRVDFSDVTAPGELLFRLGDQEKKIRINANPYGDIVSSSLRWLRTQRSGSNETVDREPAHFGDSASVIFRKKDSKIHTWDNWQEDVDGKKADMQGGWYAAGNYAKFTSAIAYTSYYLLRAYETNPSLFNKKHSQTELIDILDEARFGLSYLMKVMPDDNEFIIQVGGFDSDNGTRLPHEDKYEGKRDCYSAFSHPHMGFTVAALAIGAKVFEKEGRPEEALQYRLMAEKIFTKAMSDNFEPVWLQRGYAQFKDDTRYDNLLLGAMEMYRLTNDEKYKKKAKEFSQKAKAAYWGGWNMQNMMAHSLIAKEFKPAMGFLKNDLNHFAGTARKKDNIWGFPQDAAYSSIYMGLEAGVGAARFYEITGENSYSDMIHNVLDYTYGVNNWGVSFSATPRLENSVKDFNLAIYKLQTHLFPEGAIAPGPCDREGHDRESKWILDDVRTNYCYPYNTPSTVFLDHRDDYMTMDSWIFGAADNIYFLALASKMYGN